MDKFIQTLEKITDILGGKLQGCLVFFLMILVMIEVMGRYVLESPLSIAEELGGYILVSITFMGLGYTWKERGHVRVELVINMMSKKLRTWLRLLTVILAAAFCGPLITGSYAMLQDSLLFEARSGSWLRTPLVYPQSILLVGSILLLMQFIVEIIKAIKDLKKITALNSKENK